MASSATCRTMLRSATCQANFISTRTFTSSVALRAPPPRSHNPASTSASPAPKRRNPLIGSYTPLSKASPSREDTTPVSTEHPRTSRPPHVKPTVAPASSAEVPPNEDMPLPSMSPPPPPPPLSSAPEAPSTSPAAKRDHPYTAANASTPFNIDIASIIASKSAAYSSSLSPSPFSSSGVANSASDPQRQPQIRSDAAKGRTVFISSNPADRRQGHVSSLQQAVRRLGSIIKEDHVQRKFHSQREHERKGMKRKRLRRERWQKRFKEGFRAAAQRVMYLKRQGW